MKHFLLPLAAAAALTLSACNQAPVETPLAQGIWNVDGAASTLSYVSVKSGEIAEVNEFTTFSGSVNAAGDATLEIDLASVSTGVDIRDERMREVFFEVVEHPTATVTTSVDPAVFSQLGVGDSIDRSLEATITVKGIEAPVTAEVSVTRLANDRVLVVSTKPVVVEADSLELTEGLGKLQELANLPSITPVAPFTFAIAFTR